VAWQRATNPGPQRPASARAPAAAADRLRRADIPATTDRRRTSSASDVLRAVLDHGPVPRSTIARIAGLSPAAVGRHCADLVRAGLIREIARQGGGGNSAGRPHVPVDISDERHVVCGLHIGATASTLAVVDLRGRVLARESDSHDGRPAADVLTRAGRRIPGFAAEHAWPRQPIGLGVAAGGWVDPVAGVVVDHPALGWRDTPARDLLAETTGLPVRIDSHARALIKAEQLFGDRRSRDSVVHMFVGNVVDAAFATGGMVHAGPRSAAGSVAHLPVGERWGTCQCGQSGCLQAAVGDDAIARRAASAGIIAEPSFLALLASASAGTTGALGLMRERARLVGRAAAMLLDVLNPDLLVVAEAGAIRLPGCLDVLRAEVAKRSRNCRDPVAMVVATSFGADVLPVSAGAVLLDAIYADPLADGTDLW
jgi:predicted NBD/HSP70 family sugar kinase